VIRYKGTLVWSGLVWCFGTLSVDQSMNGAHGGEHGQIHTYVLTHTHAHRRALILLTAYRARQHRIDPMAHAIACVGAYSQPTTLPHPHSARTFCLLARSPFFACRPMLCFHSYARIQELSHRIYSDLRSTYFGSLMTLYRIYFTVCVLWKGGCPSQTDRLHRCIRT